jgi:hypothetical protein
MSRAEEHLTVYREQIIALRRAHAAGHGADYAEAFAAFGAGLLFGAGIPQAAATLAELYRLAYPGRSLPRMWEGEGP